MEAKEAKRQSDISSYTDYKSKGNVQINAKNFEAAAKLYVCIEMPMNNRAQINPSKLTVMSRYTEALRYVAAVELPTSGPSATAVLLSNRI